MRTFRPRPAYIKRKVALERARREARKTHSPECICAFCIDQPKFRQMVYLALARNASAGEEIPF